MDGLAHTELPNAQCEALPFPLDLEGTQDSQRLGSPSSEPAHVKASERWANQPGLHLPNTAPTPLSPAALSLGSSASGVHLGPGPSPVCGHLGAVLGEEREEAGVEPLEIPPHPQCSAG